MKRIALLLGSLWLSGCFAYVPVPPAQVEAGARVRAYLTPQASDQVSGKLGPKVSSLQGSVFSKQDSTFHFDVVSYNTADGGEVYANNAPLSLSEGALKSMEVRKLSVGRTILFGIVAAAIPALAGVLISGSVASLPNTNPTGGSGQSHN